MQTIKLNKNNREKAVRHVNDTAKSYENLLKTKREDRLRIYKSYTTFEEEKKAERQTSFKVNKAHEIVNKILPRIMAKNPKWIVSLRKDEFYEEDRLLTPEERSKKMANYEKMAEAVQDYLTYIFDRYNQVEPLRLWAKNMLVYGSSFAKIRFKYEVMSTMDEKKMDEDGNIISEYEYNEEVVGEYPTIEPKSWTEMLYDPRYVFLSDMPSIIERTEKVRLSELEKDKDDYQNLDKIKKLPEAKDFYDDAEEYKRKVQQIAGIDTSEMSAPIDKNKLTIDTYCGYYTYKGKEELYEIKVVNGCIGLCFRRISHIPFEDIKCFEGVETHFSTGFVEPILGLQDELNFKKNAGSEYINAAINRSRVRSPNSGIDPRDLQSKPGNIIVTSKDAQTALANVMELPMRQLPSDFFQEQNDFERQIQSATFTVDTSNARNQQALTNTATGIRVKFFESNSVIDEIRKHVEEALQRLAYKLLQATYENMDDNIVIKKMGDKGFWELNKELMKEALKRYDIKVESNSSSFDTIEDRRESALARYNIMLQAKAAGVPVDLTEGLKSVLETWEDKDVERFFEKQNPMAALMGGAQPQGGGGRPIPQPEPSMTNAAETTEAVAGGSLTSAIQ